MNANSIWRTLALKVLNNGLPVVPRGLSTIEILGNQTVIDMDKCVVTNICRNLSYKFMCAEAYWIISGDDTTAGIVPYNKNMAQFSDDGHRFFGAYGPKIRGQMSYVLQSLITDIFTRQAVINIWRENPSKTKDYPCTLSLQFIVRNYKLNCIASMRSSDVWLGYPYDIFTFSMISAWLVLALRRYREFKGLQLGELALTAGSQHIYLKDKALAQHIGFNLTCWQYSALSLDEFNGPEHLMEHLKALRDQRWSDLTANWLKEMQSWKQSK